LPYHADTPHISQIVTSRHSGYPDLAISPNVTHHKIRARALNVSQVQIHLGLTRPSY
jgi:hypothetical protein